MTDHDDLIRRFMAKVRKDESGCWLWLAQVNAGGYGRFCINYVYYQAHRVAYELFVGKIPDKLELDHLCRVRHCVNPKHLEAVTKRENILRGVSMAAIHAKKTHCIYGHEFNEENTRLELGRKRKCRACNKIGSRRRRSAALASETRSGEGGK